MSPSWMILYLGPIGLLGVERAGELSGEGKHPSSMEEARDIDNKRFESNPSATAERVLAESALPPRPTDTLGEPSESAPGLLSERLDEMQSEPGDETNEPVADSVS